MAKDKRLENLKPFKKGPDARRNTKGRPKKLISSVNSELQEKGYDEPTKSEIVSCYLRLMNVDIPTLEKMVKTKNQPALVRIVAKNILSGKGFDVIERMLDRGIGKADTKVDLTSNGNTIYTTPEERDRRIEELIAKHNANRK